MRPLLPGGVGLGWRPETAWLLQQRADLAFTEVLAENLDPREPPRALLQLRDRGTPVVVHGVGLSLGGAARPEAARLDRLARLAERLGAPFVSEHVAFVRAGRRDSRHLLPVPRNAEVLDILVENTRLAQAALPVPLALENIAALFTWPGPQIDEADFLSALLERTGAHLLLDLSNLYANARNDGFDPVAFLDRLPLERVVQLHVAGGALRDGLYIDTHAHPLSEGPLALLDAVRQRLGSAIPVLLERDEQFGTRAALEAELASIGHIQGLPGVA